VAIVAEVIEIEAVKVNKVKKVVIKIRANIKVKDVAIELKEEEVIIALIIDYYY
jgi:hypothetical protein